MSHADTQGREGPGMRLLIVPLAALALSGCAGTNFEANDLALSGAPRSRAREALQQLDPASCHGNTHREATKLADAAQFSAMPVAFTVGADRYAQLDDPTRDWTREQATAPATQCPPAGRKHRYFA